MPETKTQREIAQSLIEEINGDIVDLSELNTEFLLDMMGVIGVEFTSSDKASLEFVNGL